MQHIRARARTRLTGILIDSRRSKARVTLIGSFWSKISSPLNHSDPRCEVSTASLPEAVLGRMDLTGQCHATKKGRLAECKLCTTL
jgi:hypothetical protein